MNQSPAQSPQVTEFPKEKSRTMTFSQALMRLMGGSKVRRLEWEDQAIYLVMKDERLMIFKTDDKQLHPLIVSSGDISGTDWVVV